MTRYMFTEEAKASFGAAEVSHYGQLVSEGGRTVSVRWPALDGIEVQVRPVLSENQEEADRIAAMIARDIGRVAQIRSECADQIAAASLRRQRAEETVEFLTSPRQRFFGTPFVRPARGEDWQGEVWLVDPIRGFSGFGLRFASLAALWQAMPDLRPDAAGCDDTGPWIRVRSQQIKPEAAS